MRVLDGVEVDDLVAQFAAIVVVQVRRIGLGDAVGVGEKGAPVDQVDDMESRSAINSSRLFRSSGSPGKATLNISRKSRIV